MVFASLIAAAVMAPHKFEVSKQDESKYGELVFALDVSGSVYDSQYALRGLALEISKGQFDYYGVGNVRIAFATYGWPDKRIRLLPFTKNPDQVLAYLTQDIKSIFMVKEAGSDTAMIMLNKLDWTKRPDVKRKLIVLGNEPLMQGMKPTPIEEVALKATLDGTLVDTVFTPFSIDAGSPKEYIDLAHLAKGQSRVLSESDLVNYTAVWNKYREGYEWDLRMEAERKAQNSYLEGLLNKRARNGG